MMLALVALTLGPGIWMAQVATTELESAAAATLFGLATAVVTFGILGSSGLISTKRVQIGGSAAIWLIATELILKFVTGDYVVRGVVYVDGNPPEKATISILGADIGNPRRDLVESDLGQFQFSGARIQGKIVRFFISIPDYEPTTVEAEFSVRKKIEIKLHRENLKRIPKLGRTSFGTNSLRSPYGFWAPPIVEASIEGDGRKPTVEGVFRKVRAGKAAEPLAVDNLRVNQVEASLWHAAFDTGDLIRRYFSDFPHGNYETTVVVKGTVSSQITTNVNYLYRLPLESRRDTLRSSLPGACRIEDGLDLEFVCKSRTNSVWALLSQEFEFKQNFLVRGAFTIKPTIQGVEYSPALDVTLGDQWGDRVSVILGEDGGESYSIKYMTEPVRRTGAQDRRNKGEDSEHKIAKDGVTTNSFEIRFVREAGSDLLQCSVFIGTVLRSAAPVFSRLLPGNCLDVGPTRVRLKVWKSGVVRISNLEVGEIPTI